MTAGAAGQRIGDPALIVELADEAVPGAPDMQDAAGPGMAERVGGDLADRQHEVGGAAGGKPGLGSVAGDEVAYRAQVRRVAEHGRARRRLGQRRVAALRDAARPRVLGAGLLFAVVYQDGMGPPGLVDDR